MPLLRRARALKELETAHGSTLYGVSCPTEGCLGFAMETYFDTPGQAVAAWNRRSERTCRMDEPIDGEYRCSECGHLNRETYRADKGWYPPKYCAHCGARAVGCDDASTR